MGAGAEPSSPLTLTTAVKTIILDFCDTNRLYKIPSKVDTLRPITTFISETARDRPMVTVHK